MKLNDDILSALALLAADAVHAEIAAGVPSIEPIPGDIVVAVDGYSTYDPDSIGTFVKSDNGAVYTKPLRWIRDLGEHPGDALCWRITKFARVPARVHALVEALLRSP